MSIQYFDYIYLVSHIMRATDVTAKATPVPRVVAIVAAGTRTGLNMMRSGADTANATAKPASIIPAKPIKITEATGAATTLITSKSGVRNANTLQRKQFSALCDGV